MRKTKNKGFRLSSNGALRLLDLEKRVRLAIFAMLGWLSATEIGF
jgi:hypothetical protein